MSRPPTSPPKPTPPSKRPKLGHTTSITDMPSMSTSLSATAMGPPPRPQQGPSPPCSRSPSPRSITTNQDITDLITREATRLQAANHLVRARNELLARMRTEGLMMEKSELADRAGKIGDAVEKGLGDRARVTDGPARWSDMGGRTLQGEGTPGLQGHGHRLNFFMGHFGRESEQGLATDETPDEEQILDNLSTEGSIDSNEERDLFEDLPEGAVLPADEMTLREEGNKDGHMRAEKGKKEEERRGEQAVQDKVAESKIRDFAKEAADLQEVQKLAKGSEAVKESKRVQVKAKVEVGTEKSKGNVPSLGKQDGEPPGAKGSSGSSGSTGSVGPSQRGVSVTTTGGKETETTVEEESSEEQEFVIVGEVESEESSKDEGKVTEKKQD
ncbi:MAG: hypothetical protein L6R37_007756 [Teloschistes peruensis]|nr:MAG: hypothetical protein L6R37_007756 [Teloschistes peruensis]